MFANMSLQSLLIGVAGCGAALIMGCQTSRHDTPVASSSWEGGAPPRSGSISRSTVSPRPGIAGLGETRLRELAHNPAPLTTVPTDRPNAPSNGDGTVDEHRHSGVPAGTSGVARMPYGGQQTCPVSGEELGSMGDPIPVAVKGQTVYVCCWGCVGKVKANPEKNLAKVRKETGRGD